MMQRMTTDASELLRPLTPEEREAGLLALEMVRQHAEQRMAERGGRPYAPSSTELLEQIRREEEDDAAGSA